MGNTSGKSLPVVSPDQEVWVKNAIIKAILMGIKIARTATVRADEELVTYGLDGIAEGAAIEVIRTMGYINHYTNFKNLNPKVNPCNSCPSKED